METTNKYTLVIKPDSFLPFLVYNTFTNSIQSAWKTYAQAKQAIKDLNTHKTYKIAA